MKVESSKSYNPLPPPPRMVGVDPGAMGGNAVLDDSSIKYLIRKGRDHLKYNDYGKAFDCYERVLKNKPNDEKALIGMAKTLEYMDRLSDAVSYYDQLPENRQESKILNRMANKLDKIGSREKAKDYRDRAQKLNPDYIKTLSSKPNLTVKLITDGTADDISEATTITNQKISVLITKARNAPDEKIAGKCYDDVLRLDSNNLYALIRRGEILNKTGKYKLALSCFDRILHIDTSDIRALNGRAKSLHKLGSHKSSLKTYDKILATCKKLKKKPKMTSMPNNKSKPLHKRGRQRTPRSYSEIEINDYVLHALISKGEQLENTGILDEALLCCKKASITNPKHFRALVRKANLLDRLSHDEAQKTHKKVIDYCKNILTKNPDDIYALTNNARSLEKLGRYDEALSCYDAALEKHSGHLDMLFRKANLLARLARWKDSQKVARIVLRATEKELKKNPTSINLLTKRIGSLERLGRYNEALSCCDYALKNHSNNIALLNRKCYILINLGLLTKALKYSERVLSKHYSNIEALNNKAFILSRLCRHSEALNCLELLLRLRPCYPPAINRKGYVLSNLGRDDEALSCYDEVLRINPNYLPARNHKAFTLSKLGRNKDALECIDRALEINQNYLSARNHKAAILSRLGRNEDALECIDRALEINQSHLYTRQNKAIILYKLGRIEEGQAYLDTKDIENGQLHDDEKVDLIKLHDIDTMIKDKPNDLGLYRYKANILYGLGEHKKAIACLDHALDIDPDNVGLLSAKVHALSGLGRYEETVECANRVIEIDPTDKSVLDKRDHAMGFITVLGNNTPTGQPKSIAVTIDGDQSDNDLELKKMKKYNEAGEHLFQNGLYTFARGPFKAAAKISPSDQRTRYNLALLDDATGRYYEAADELDWLLEARRNSSDVDDAPCLDDIFILRGLVHAHEGNHEDAIEYYDKLSDVGDRIDVAYLRADSLYRLGRYDEAVIWYGKAKGFRDAIKRQGEIRNMRNDMPGRIWIPLIAADTPAGIPSIPHIQYAVYLAQTEKTSKYHFDSSAPGPYSEDLALDIARNTELFKVDRGDIYSFSQRRTYTLTPKGRDMLKHAKLDDDIVARIKKYRDMDVVDLARMAHARFSAHFDAVHLGQMIQKIIDDVDEDKNLGYQNGSIGMEAYHVKHVLSEIARNTESMDKKIIYGISSIIVNWCEKIHLLSGSPVDHYEVQRIIEDLGEYGSLLLKYAKTNKIVAYPSILNPVKKIAS